MKEKIKDTIVDLLLDGVKNKLDSVKENYKWQKLFVSTGDFFVNNPDVLVKFEEALSDIAEVEIKPKLEGRSMFMQLTPKK